MNVIIAIDSFKGCLTSVEAAAAATQGVLQAMPGAHVTALPVSDGGEGMLEAFTAAMDGRIVDVPCHDPLLRPIRAKIGLSHDDKTAIIESAQAVGLSLVKPRDRNVLLASSWGVGELIAHAVRRGCERLIVGLGGTATSDAGRGMLQALGVDIADDQIDTSRFVLRDRMPEVIVASDVDNPLCGPRGAAQVYGPQKGARPVMVRILEREAARFARLTAAHTGRDCSTLPGAGAAGGLGFALMSYLDATMRPGTDLLLDLLDFDNLLDSAHLVITGEGHADRQTLHGKLPLGVLRRAERHGVPVMLIAGGVSDRKTLLEAGFTAVHCINEPGTPHNEAMRPDVAARRIAATVAAALRPQNG